MFCKYSRLHYTGQIQWVSGALITRRHCMLLYLGRVMYSDVHFPTSSWIGFVMRSVDQLLCLSTWGSPSNCEVFHFTVFCTVCISGIKSAFPLLLCSMAGCRLVLYHPAFSFGLAKLCWLILLLQTSGSFSSMRVCITFNLSVVPKW